MSAAQVDLLREIRDSLRRIEARLEPSEPEGYLQVWRADPAAYARTRMEPAPVPPDHPKPTTGWKLPAWWPRRG